MLKAKLPSRTHKQPGFRPSSLRGSAARGAAGRLRAAAGCRESTTRRSPRGHCHWSTRLLQSWRTRRPVSGTPPLLSQVVPPQASPRMARSCANSWRSDSLPRADGRADPTLCSRAEVSAWRSGCHESAPFTPEGDGSRRPGAAPTTARMAERHTRRSRSSWVAEIVVPGRGFRHGRCCCAACDRGSRGGGCDDGFCVGWERHHRSRVAHIAICDSEIVCAWAVWRRARRVDRPGLVACSVPSRSSRGRWLSLVFHSRERPPRDETGCEEPR